MRGRTIVVGAGLAGLACAFDLSRAGREVLVLEAGARAGGVVGTIECGGFRFETGPNTVLASAASFRTLCCDLGIADRLVTSKATASTRWIFHRGRLRALPTNPLALVTNDLLSRRGKLALVLEPFRGFVPPHDEPTLEAFLVERLGREAAIRLGGAFVRGVYAAELSELGAESAFPRLWEMALQHGSLVRGALMRSMSKRAALPGPNFRRGAMLSFPRGLVELVDALSARLGPRVKLRTRVDAIERFDTGWLVRGQDFAAPCTSAVIATPAPIAARILASALDAEERAFVSSVAHARIAVVHLGFGALALPAGFGFLVSPDEPRDEAPRALGTIFTTNVFERRAPEGFTATTSFYRNEDVAGLDDAALTEQARRDLALALGRAVPDPIERSIMRWEDVIPRLAPRHSERVNTLRSALHVREPSLELAGAWLDGVSVDDVIASGRAAASQLLDRSHRIAAEYGEGG